MDRPTLSFVLGVIALTACIWGLVPLLTALYTHSNPDYLPSYWTSINDGQLQMIGLLLSIAAIVTAIFERRKMDNYWTPFNKVGLGMGIICFSACLLQMILFTP